MPSVREWSSRVPATLAAALFLAGCPLLDEPVPGGSVAGKVQFFGRPAPGKMVSLLVAKGGSFVTAPTATASTNAQGDYLFTGLPAGTYRATYVSQAVPDGNNVKRDPNEIGIWRTKARDVSSGAGARMPAFDVAYNGLIYPATGTSYIVARGMPLPFHWSTHIQAQKYRLILYNNSLGRDPPMFTSTWETVPTALYEENVRASKYSWEVVIDAGEAGEGRALVRQLDMGPPNQTGGGEDPGVP